ncbi:hypothetical protein DUNSADRAFT_3125 [Dunaliella salina]|uniref:SEC7 domain-containing protein n=1 Tax=Dunaliella salina TaxID=3046 RepID=A0ABQ7H816_DUNSA|nr:hypothetical protein DUNSADRAFT_3125 [Dunaliella salina]|eukprot:KAF5842997.1 hypothetical protein DUNSADRAFT_3125 [Dunaliella salina]
MVVDSNAFQTHEQLTLLLSHEISAVITAMRYNSKWAVVPRYYEEDRNEPSRYDDAFRTLLSEIYVHEDWSVVDPMLYLMPFLSLIKASDVSGPITGAAAVALQRILGSNLIRCGQRKSMHQHMQHAGLLEGPAAAAAAPAPAAPAAAAASTCTSTSNVLEQAVQCNAGVLLSDDTLCKSFQAAFMLGDPISKPKEYGDIMGYYSRQACGSMVRALFTRLRLSEAKRSEDADEETLGGRSSGNMPGSSDGGMQLRSQDDTSKQAQQCRHGIGAASEIVDFLVDLIKKDPTQAPIELVEETIVFALDLVHTALLSVGHDLMDHDMLVAQVHVELLHAICQAVVTFPSISIISGFCQIMLAIYTFIGTISIGQIELVLEKVLLKLADGKGVSSLEQQEAALEGILELVRTPGFIHDVFVNCDCRMQRGNLFLDLVALLSRTALPHSGAKSGGGAAVGAGLGPLHAVSLEALLAILRAIAAENKPDNFVPPPPELELPCFVDIWSALAAGEHPDLTPLMRAAPAATIPSRASSVTSAAGIRPATASTSYPAAGASAQTQGHSSLDQGAAFLIAPLTLCLSHHRSQCTAPKPQQLGPRHTTSHNTPHITSFTSQEPVHSPKTTAAWTKAQHFSQHPSHCVFHITGASAQPQNHSSLDQGAAFLATPLTLRLFISQEPVHKPKAAAAWTKAQHFSQHPSHCVFSQHRSQCTAPKPQQLGPGRSISHNTPHIASFHITGASAQTQGRSSLDQGVAAPVAGGGNGGRSMHSSREQAAGAASQRERLASGAEASASGSQSHSGLRKGAGRNRPSDYERLESAVLDAYTASFNFHDLRFDAAIRLFLESFRLPGEAQKIDRIINSFGNHFYHANPGIFCGPDAAYVLAYSVIMLNTDRHNAQVKNKMSLESFRRNLRGVNEGADFPVEFLNDIYHSIAKTPLRMSEDSSLQISEQQLMELHQLSGLPRGQMVHADPGRHLFDVSMFRLMWQPTVTAMAAIVDCAQPPPLSQVLPSLAPDLPTLERGGPSPLASVEDLPTAADAAPHTLNRSQDGSLVAEYPGTLRSLTRASQNWPGSAGTGPIMPLIDSALDGLQVWRLLGCSRVGVGPRDGGGAVPERSSARYFLCCPGRRWRRRIGGSPWRGTLFARAPRRSCQGTSRQCRHLHFPLHHFHPWWLDI